VEMRARVARVGWSERSELQQEFQRISEGCWTSLRSVQPTCYVLGGTRFPKPRRFRKPWPFWKSW